ncbi:MAG: copper resistance protein CopC [Planctomycetes bacterium]|nr:copper resistance protein CopC [Planctomycetota bacterium]
MFGKPTLFFLGLGLFCAAASAADGKPGRFELGRRIKFTILVDKVMQPQEGWVTKEWMVKAAADAGFNVFSPRVGHDRLDEVRQVADWCAKHGIFYMPWMRGSLRAPTGPKADGKRLVWADGTEQPLWSPNSDEFWRWTARYIVEYAKISRTNRHLMGVFLDYENYAPGRRGHGNLYSLSYDDVILEKFAQSKGIKLPALKLSERKKWLQDQGLHEPFEQFQVDHSRQRCRELRKAVDRFDPTFHFCVYPAPGTPFMVRAIYPEWATQQAPLILADASTYGRASRFLHEQEALKVNQKKLQERRKIAEEAGIPFFYVGGIDPIVRGADPEFSGKNAVAISEVTDGYWIFYEGPTYTKQDHADYWKWFAWANRAIAAGRFDVQHEARQTPEGWQLELLGQLKGRQRRLVAPAGNGKEIELPFVRLRRDNLLLLACRAGRPVRVTLENIPVGRYDSSLVWEVRDPQMVKVHSGVIPVRQTGTIQFVPANDGVYLLTASAGGCAYCVSRSNVPVGFCAAQGLGLIGPARRLYFRVPKSVDRFTLQFQGSGSETVRVNVFAPEGELVASAQTEPQKNANSLTVPVAPHGAGVWSVELTRADQGVLEDHTLRLLPPLTPVLSVRPDHAFESEVVRAE